jgi:hypothetical protein
MTEALFTQLVQLGAAVVIIAFIWLIIQAIVKFAGANDKENSATINTLSTLLSTFTTNLSKNTDVLIRLEAYMMKTNEETNTIFNRIEATISRNYSAHNDELKILRSIIEDVRQQMDKTIPIGEGILDELDKE